MKTKEDINEKDSDFHSSSSSDSGFVHIRKSSKHSKMDLKEEGSRSVDTDSGNKPKKRGRPPKSSKADAGINRKENEEEEDEEKKGYNKPSMLAEPVGPLWQRAKPVGSASDAVKTRAGTSAKSVKGNESISLDTANNPERGGAKIFKPKQETETAINVLFTYSDRQFPESNAEVKVGLGEAYLKGTQRSKHLTLKSLMTPEEGADSIVYCRYRKGSEVEETYLDNDSIILQNFSLEKDEKINGIQYYTLPPNIREALKDAEAYKLLYP